MARRVRPEPTSETPHATTITKNPDQELIESAHQFDVYKWSDYPEVNSAVNSIYGEIEAFRKSKQIRIRGADQVKKHLKVTIIDLWAGYRLGMNPYRGVSKNKSDYQKADRYRKIFLTYDYLIHILDDLTDLGYIEQVLGSQKEGLRTRIKATQKLIDKILSPEFKVNDLVSAQGDLSIIQINPNSNPELIWLSQDDDDNADRFVQYEDNDSINLMRENLKAINEKIAKSKVSLWLSNNQFEDLFERLKRKKDIKKRNVDFTKNQLYRIFNNRSFERGGRFYGGWWQNIPKDFRKYIEINRKTTVEVDYSGHHIRMLYALEGLAPPDDPYDISGFDRDTLKEAMMIMINSPTRLRATKKIEHMVADNSAQLIRSMTERHSQIQHHFFTSAGLSMMYKDSQLAEKVMLEMMKRGATVLPVHDSFIVRNSYADELEQVMTEEFERMFEQKAKLSFKKTMLEEVADQRPNPDQIQFASDNLEELLNKKGYSVFYRIFGL